MNQPSHTRPVTTAATMSKNGISPATSRASPASGVGAIATTITTTTAVIAAHHQGFFMRAATMPRIKGRTKAAKSRPSSAMFTNGIVGAWSSSRGLASLTMAGVTDPDRCPGVLRPHLAADGAMVRIRVPGGQTTGTAIRQLSRIAQRFGSADLQLTSRASLQLRGLADPVPDSLIHAVRGAGFLPSVTHERVRNIVASPLTGVSGGMADVRSLVVALDKGLCARPRLASLPSRFLFAIDDGRGDLSATKFDLGYRAIDHDRGWLLIGSPLRGALVAAEDAVEALLELAHRCLAAARGAGDTWPGRDRANWARTVPGVRTINLPPGATGTPLGAIAGAASVQVPLALLTPAQVATVEACAPGQVVITPARGLVLPGAARQMPELVAAGMVEDPASPWSAISACVGAPACHSSLIDTRAYATALAQSRPPVPRTHISGCERRCGAPAGDHRDLVAPDADDLLTPVGRAR
jgi:precorrin-3B synthase